MKTWKSNNNWIKHYLICHNSGENKLTNKIYQITLLNHCSLDPKNAILKRQITKPHKSYYCHLIPVSTRLCCSNWSCFMNTEHEHVSEKETNVNIQYGTTIYKWQEKNEGDRKKCLSRRGKECLLKKRIPSSYKTSSNLIVPLAVSWQAIL